MTTSNSPPSSRQIELLSKEDWRYHAVDAGGNDGLIYIATTEKVDGQVVSFGLPSAPAMYLNLARAAWRRRTAIDLPKQFVRHSHPQGTWPEEHGLLFDFLEAMLAEVIFSFTSLEAFANEMIPLDFEYTSIGHLKTEMLNRDQIERRVQLDEKLKKVLPKAYNVKKPGRHHSLG